MKNIPNNKVDIYYDIGKYPWLWILVFIILLIIGAYLFGLFNKNNSGIPLTTVTQTTTKPTSKSEPVNTDSVISDRAYKASAVIITNSSKTSKIETKKSYGNENMSDTELIRMIAKKFDNDPALLAQAEALIEKNMKSGSFSGNSQNNNLYDPDIEAQNRTSRCQLEYAEYNACTSKYNADLTEYNTCLTQKLANGWGFCSKPLNLCFKPVCH